MRFPSHVYTPAAPQINHRLNNVFGHKKSQVLTKLVMILASQINFFLITSVYIILYVPLLLQFA
ncbi:hypothetical protein Scep_019933 [Stephania cephalantha]|uniref:Uncharacterized protein n=1 Tax=Stephania cephalantha TaxID=152367 RepID=A0AAP0IBL2_9MAGN